VQFEVELTAACMALGPFRRASPIPGYASNPKRLETRNRRVPDRPTRRAPPPIRSLPSRPTSGLTTGAQRRQRQSARRSAIKPTPVILLPETASQHDPLQIPGLSTRDHSLIPPRSLAMNGP
jgi:hypothetical protein